MPRNDSSASGDCSSDLSQAIESAGTPTGALLPWHAGGAYMAGVLGVSTLQYAQYYFFGYLSPLVLFAFVLAGVGFSGNSAAQPGPAAPAATGAGAPASSSAAAADAVSGSDTSLSPPAGG